MLVVSGATILIPAALVMYSRISITSPSSLTLIGHTAFRHKLKFGSTYECARDYIVLTHIRFKHTVNEVVREHDLRRWRIETSKGAYLASLLISAGGTQ